MKTSIKMMMRKMKMTSNESSLTPFLHWGEYKSKDENNPDVLHLKVVDAEPLATTYTMNIDAEVDAKGISGPEVHFHRRRLGQRHQFSLCS